ncbi:hypothetical protein OBBRIDRAFT_267768 [Obba rivulosa]|uniref:Secreted protein n=1 Tax=Obba rivulosa TaxID=1052685 RepID=A0A8E2J366_9APHY|nr:hypothetical protein OBBRIDRAFT_267768 [Obba rivulosa]
MLCWIAHMFPFTLLARNEVHGYNCPESLALRPGSTENPVLASCGIAEFPLLLQWVLEVIDAQIHHQKTTIAPSHAQCGCIWLRLVTQSSCPRASVAFAAVASG